MDEDGLEPRVLRARFRLPSMFYHVLGIVDT